MCCGLWTQPTPWFTPLSSLVWSMETVLSWSPSYPVFHPVTKVTSPEHEADHVIHPTKILLQVLLSMGYSHSLSCEFTTWPEPSLDSFSATPAELWFHPRTPMVSHSPQPCIAVSSARSPCSCHPAGSSLTFSARATPVEATIPLHVLPQPSAPTTTTSHCVHPFICLPHSLAYTLLGPGHLPRLLKDKVRI